MEYNGDGRDDDGLRRLTVRDLERRESIFLREKKKEKTEIFSKKSFIEPKENDTVFPQLRSVHRPGPGSEVRAAICRPVQPRLSLTSSGVVDLFDQF